MIQERKIKGLSSQIKKLTGDSEALKIEISNKQKERSNKIKTIKELQKQIDFFKQNKKPTVSEHAIVRYFERIKGFDISEIEKEILSEEVLKLVETLGGKGTYPNKDFRVIMNNFTVTTITN